MPYLRREELFTSLNHVASRVNGHITAAHIASLLPWVDGLEVRNGSRLAAQNRTATCLAEAYDKVPVGGSDSHTRRGIGRTWVEAPGAKTRDEFMTALQSGRVRVGGRHGNFFTMASDILRPAAGFYEHRLRLLVQSPLSWRWHAFVLGGVLGLPLVSLPVAAAVGHFLMEERFSQELLHDLVARPAATRVPEVA